MEQVSSIGLYRFPSPSSDRESTFTRTKPVRLTLGFAITSIVLGFGSAILQITDLSTLAYAPSNYLCFGVWCGFLYILAGSLTVDAAMFHNNRTKMTLATGTSAVASIFATLAAAWSIQDRLYVHDHNMTTGKGAHASKHHTGQVESEDCFADWMQWFQLTVHCAVVVVSCLAVVSNTTIFLIQASVLLNSKRCTLQGAFEHLFAMPSFNLVTNFSLSGGKDSEKERLLGKNKSYSFYQNTYHTPRYTYPK